MTQAILRYRDSIPELQGVLVTDAAARGPGIVLFPDARGIAGTRSHVRSGWPGLALSCWWPISTAAAGRLPTVRRRSELMVGLRAGTARLTRAGG